MNTKINPKTKKDLDALLLFLDTVERKIFKREELKISEIEDEWQEYSWFKNIREAIEDVKSSDYEERLKIVKDIEEELSKVEEIKLILPFEPSKAFINKVYSSLEANNSSGFLLDISVDKNLKSGGKLFRGGKYTNLTFKQKIEDLISKEDVISKYL